MPWVVGIDEAGYGPNLGPLVQTAVALPLPEDDLAGWETLRPRVRRCHEPDDGRLVIDDSKKVNTGPRGFERLERGVFGTTGRAAPVPFGTWLYSLSDREWLDDLCLEPWFDPNQPLPFVCPMPADGCLSAARLLARLVPAPRFNRQVSAAGSKGVVLSDGLIALAAAVPFALPDPEPVHFVCDKLGGRNFYAPLLQQAFPDGWVIAEKESVAESRYRVMNLDREVVVTFRPRADADSVAVALASMLAKYVREVCMRQFNAFWATHVPGIKPTAGYPVDAKRFFAEIQPAMDRLGIPPEAVWRCR